MVYRLLCLSLLVPLAAYAAVDQSPHFAARIDIENYGIYSLVKRRERDFVAQSTAGYASVINTRLVQQTQAVPLKKGQVFGFNFAITDADASAQWVPVKILIHHPDTRNYLGHQSQGFTREGAARLKPDGRYHNGAFYILSEPYELVPGEWQISVIYRDDVVAFKRFVVK